MNVFLHSEQIATRVNGLGSAIGKHYEGKPLVALILMKGAFIFAADLIRRLERSVPLEFMRAESYEGTASSGRVLLERMPEWRKYGSSQGVMPHLLVIEDIVDTGLTLSALLPKLESVGFQSVEVCCLLHKTANSGGYAPRWVGFEIPPAFVVGYGMDHNGHYRNLSYIAQLDG